MTAATNTIGAAALRPPAGWDTIAREEIAGVGPVGLWRHDSGATHLHAFADVAEFGFGLTMRTEAADDHGTAHVLEHLVGAGSRRYPASSPLYTSMFRLMSFFNGFTESGRTTYTYVVGDPDDHADMLDVLLDGVYHPLLGRREFLREGCRQLPRGSDGPDAPARFSGVVYNEMRRNRETESQWMARLLARAVRPFGWDQFRHEGSPDGLVGLTYDVCLEFHRAWYRPCNAHSFSSGPVLPAVLARLGAAHDTAAAETASAPGTRPAQPGELPAPIGPSGHNTAEWQVVRSVFPATTAGWRAGVAARGRLTAADRGIRPDLVVGPSIADGLLELLAGYRPDTAADLTAVKGLLTRAGPSGVTTAEVCAYRTQRYTGLPAQMRWGLEVAGDRVAGLDLLTIIGDAPDLDVAVTAAETVDVWHVRADAPGVPLAWSPARAAAEEAVWRTSGIGSSTSCLPLRPLNRRRAPATDYARRVDDRIEHVRRPEPDSLYLHVRLPVDPTTAHLVVPVRDLIVALAGPQAGFSLPAADRIHVRRTATGGCVADLLLPVALLRPSPLQPTAAPERLSEVQLRNAVAAFVRRRSAALLTGASELATRQVCGRLTTAGAGAELVEGLSAVTACVATLRRSDGLLSAAQAVVDAVRAAPATVLVVGDRVTRQATEFAVDLPVPSLVAGPCEDSTRVVTTGHTRLVRPDGFSPQHAVTCGGWRVSEGDPAERAAWHVLAEHLQLAHLHVAVREESGAYAVGTSVDRFASTVTAWSEADPEPTRTLRLVGALPDRVVAKPIESDELETAKLMAVTAERRRCASLSYLAAEVAHSADGVAPSTGPSTFVADVERVTVEQVRVAAERLAAAAYVQISFS